MSSVLVTGASGFLGHHLTAHLQQQAWHVVLADRTHGIDIRDRDQVESLPDVDVVVHLAAVVHVTDQPFSAMETNILGTHNLLKRYANRVTRFVMASTAQVYDTPSQPPGTSQPLREHDPLMVQNIAQPESFYVASKIANEAQVLNWYYETLTDFNILRIFNLYGPGQTCQFLPDFVARVKQRDYIVNACDSVRSWLYVDDACSAISAVISSHQARNHIINLCGAESATIKKLAELAMITMNKPVNLLQCNDDGSTVRVGDASKLQNLVNFEPRYTLDVALPITVESML